ncbi:MAG: hypothetical protein DHS20C08_23500 [Rhodomicrobium sp.]|nr:MAG: hypothetical protein DHS20C08_23500 [Rhodomicrobium sp.]
MSKIQQYELNFDQKQNLETTFVKSPSRISYLMPPRYCPKITSLAITLTMVGVCLVAYYCYAYIYHTPMVETVHLIKLLLELAFLFLCTAAVWKHAIIRG